MSGNVVRMIFCNTSINPNAVPNSLGLTTIGIAGIMMVAKVEMESPSIATGIHLTNVHSRRDGDVSMKNINAYVKKKQLLEVMIR